MIICYARSGGTILNKCLGSLPGVFILSEVSPLNEYALVAGATCVDERITVHKQAHDWLKIELGSYDYVANVQVIKEHCAKTGIKLLIRDWTFACFEPIPINEYAPPERLLNLQKLSEISEVTAFAFVRDSIDVWISRGKPPIKQFFLCYEKYVDAILASDICIFKYEDFCREPKVVVRRICKYTGLVYSDDFLDKYHDYRWVIGDEQVSGGSRGKNERKIVPLPRKRIARNQIHELNASREMARANEKLGYATYYEAAPIESRISHFKYYIRRASNLLYEQALGLRFKRTL